MTAPTRAVVASRHGCRSSSRRRASQTLRVPWALLFRPATGALLARVALSRTAFAPSDTTPAILVVQAGALVREDGPADRAGAAARHPALHRERAVPRRAGATARSAARLVQLRHHRPRADERSGSRRALRAAARRLADAATRRAAEPRAGLVPRSSRIRRSMAAAAPETHLRENPFRIAQQQLQSVADDVRYRRPSRQRPAGVQEGGRGLDPDVDGRRLGPGVHRLSRHAQRRARPVEGRHPLPPRRHARRGQGARDVDDLEVRADGPAVRRREGRRRSATRSRCRAASSSG